MIVLVKQLWQRRTAIERALGTKLPTEQADKLSAVADIVWTAYITNKIERERKLHELGLLGEKPAKRLFSLSRRLWDRREAQFNVWAAKAGEEEINVGVPPVSIEDLPGLQLNTIDLIQLREVGIIAPRKNDGA